MQQAMVGMAVQWIARAVRPWRKSAELHLAELARKMTQRFWQLDLDADDIGREAHDIGHLTGHRDRFGHGLGDNGDVGDDPRLTGMDHVVTWLLPAKHLALDETDAAGAANPGAAVMRQFDAIEQRPVEQQVTAIRQIRLVVDRHLADLTHHSTSSRIGRTCRVCRI